jgi:hypothetical protein
MADYLYGNYVQELSDCFQQSVDSIKYLSNCDAGPEFEMAICGTLKMLLPNKYGICRGFVVAQNGRHAGDAIVIYDQGRFPRVRTTTLEDLARKQAIPIEAVYAYIEFRHTVNIHGDASDGQSLNKALGQVATVKALLDTREPFGFDLIDDQVRMPEGQHLVGPSYRPQLRNPSYGIVLARNVRRAKGSDILKSPEEIEQAFSTFPYPKEPTDFVVLGDSVLLHPYGIAQINAMPRKAFRTFYMPGITEMALSRVRGIAFGIALCGLFSVLDSIRLWKVPWPRIIVDAMGEPLWVDPAGQE